ncbi:hypothetical protein OSB04_024264 [Centaurea solstitialis]|uniref:Integrase catalytic domain-containing protein n=1 Tax=Centaurea solstitialis TaxID=347529 RepID=A0AA38T489_9ASTR|nr:hypothetical protein OSB04_024264 [Centaurea solstitialis]
MRVISIMGFGALHVKTAFLNGKLTEDVYMKQPEGFEDPKNPNKVCKLLKSIYGLKQASRSWNLHFDERIKEFGFTKSEFEPCVYTKFSGSIVTFLVLYVDDILLIGNDVPTLQSVKSWLSKCFQMKDLGEAAYILGIKIYRNRSRRLIGLSQSTYIDKILKKFRMDESKKGFIPMQHGIVLSKTQCPVSSQDQDKMKLVPYASAIGSIMYAMLCTRPDVAYSVSVTSRYQQNPGEPHWVAVKNILKYLRRTKEMFLVFGGTEDEISVTGYSDASFQTDRDDFRSQSGYVFTLNGGAISWKSSKQDTIADSTTEAEYIAASDAAKEAVWLRNFLSDLRVVASISRPIDIFCDNSGAVAQAKEPREHHKSGHVLRKYHLIREIIGRGDPLARVKHEAHANSIGMQYLEATTPVNGLYTVNLQDDNKEIYHISKRSKDIEDQTYLWHCRLGHINKKRVELLLKEGFLGTFDFKPFDNSESCLSGKMTKEPFNKDNERATDLLAIVHTDVCGPFSHEARGGYRYFITFTDDFSRYGYVYLMRHKSESFEKFREYQNEVQNQLDRKIKFLRSDRGCEYLSQEFGNHLRECGIVSQLTPPYTPQMNGVSERRNRTLLDMVYVKRPTSEKLKPKSDKCFFVGYPKTTVGYYFYNPEENKVFVARNGKFLEEKFLSSGNTREDVDIQDLRRSTRVRQEPDMYLGFLVSQVGGDLNEPTSYGEVVSGSESEQWQEAMKAEMQSMYDNQVWELTDLPQHCRAVGRKWVFKKKTDMDGNVHTFKARLVAKGFTQTHGIDYDETFSPVAMLKSIRILMAISTYFNYEIWQMDVKTAFLNGKLTEDVYMEQPEGFEDPKNPNKVCKLLKSIYGLKQASRSWNLYFDERIKEFGFAKSEFEPCVYTKFSGSIVTFLFLYVDNILLIGNDVPTLQSVKSWLSKCFQMKDLGEAAYILGIKIYTNRSKRLIGLSQSTYIDKILKKFRIDESKKGFIPMQHGIVLSKTQCPVSSPDQDKMKSVPYASAIGSIMYAMLCTRPDVAYSVSVTSRYQQNPGEPHWVAVKNILKYLRITKDMFLVFGGSEDEISITGYSDANSTTEAEYIAASDAAKEAVWLRNFLSDLRVVASVVSRPIDIFCDNSGAVAQAKEPREHHKSRHVLRKYHLI